MNKQSNGAIYLFHDYPLINNGLERMLSQSEHGLRLKQKSPHPVEEFQDEALLFCGMHSLHQFLFKGEIHPELQKKAVKVILLVDKNAQVDLNTLVGLGVKGIVSTDIALEVDRARIGGLEMHYR